LLTFERSVQLQRRFLIGQRQQRGGAGGVQAGPDGSVTRWPGSLKALRIKRKACCDWSIGCSKPVNKLMA
jgi:hypothetical protein